MLTGIKPIRRNPLTNEVLRDARADGGTSKPPSTPKLEDVQAIKPAPLEEGKLQMADIHCQNEGRIDQDYENMKTFYPFFAYLPEHQQTLNGGPFHYNVRAGTYGEVYDEIPWRVRFGMATYHDRGPEDPSSQHKKYSEGVLMHNWPEIRRDRECIRNHRTPISQYTYIYTSTYADTIGKKRVCDKERHHLLRMKSYPLSPAPAYQQELDMAMLRACVPKPANCIINEARDKYWKKIASQRARRCGH